MPFWEWIDFYGRVFIFEKCATAFCKNTVSTLLILGFPSCSLLGRVERAGGCCVLGAQRDENGMQILLWGCWGWQGCDSRAGVHLCCSAVAPALELGVEGVGLCCSFVPPQPWVFTAASFAIKQKCRCAVTVSSVKYSSCLLVWDQSISSVWNSVCFVVWFFQYKAVKGTKHINSSKCCEL